MTVLFDLIRLFEQARTIYAPNRVCLYVGLLNFVQTYYHTANYALVGNRAHLTVLLNYWHMGIACALVRAWSARALKDMLRREP